MDLILSDLSGIVILSTREQSQTKKREANGKDNRPNCWLTVRNSKEQGNWSRSGSNQERQWYYAYPS
jgi:hypothetical protein